jgi:DNA invertase Pin-like site-specific DNA recombinase
MKRVAIYARVSTNDQTTQNQVLVLRELAESQGATVVFEFLDKGISGIKKDRDALNAMLTAAKSRKFETLYVYSIDRLSRSVKNLIETVETLNSLGITIVFKRESIDTQTAMGQFFLTVLGSLALNRPGICRHFLASNLRPNRRCHESQEISRRI